MKKGFYIILILFISVTQAQDTKWSLSLLYSKQSVSDRNAILDNETNSSYFDGIAFNRIDQSVLLGIIAKRHFSSGLFLSSGVSIANRDFGITGVCHVCSVIDFDVIPQKVRQRYVSIPAAVGYRLERWKLQPSAYLGVVNNYKTDVSQYGSRTYYLDGQFGLGLDVAVLKHLNFGIHFDRMVALSKVFDFQEKASSQRIKSQGVSLSYEF